MTQVAICFVIPGRKKAQEYLIQVKYYLATIVVLGAIRTISKIKNLSI